MLNVGRLISAYRINRRWRSTRTFTSPTIRYGGLIQPDLMQPIGTTRGAAEAAGPVQRTAIGEESAGVVVNTPAMAIRPVTRYRPTAVISAISVTTTVT